MTNNPNLRAAQAFAATDNQNQQILESVVQIILRYTDIDEKTWIHYCRALWKKANPEG